MKKILMSIGSLAMACGLAFGITACAGGNDGTRIVVYNREDGSGTRDAFLELIGVSDEELYLGDAQHSTTGAVVNAVATNEDSIGYISLGSVDTSVKALSVDGVAPSEETVLDGSYKVSRPFELMYQTSNDSDLLAEFLKYFDSAEAQEIIADEGYVSIVENPVAYTMPAEQFTDTELSLSGSTSVGPLMEILAADYVAMVEEALGQTITITVGGGGSGQGITDAEEGRSDIGMASKEVTSADFDDGSVMEIKQLCSDGIAVVVNPSNTVTNITLDQLKGIYTEQVTTWEEIDGYTAADAE